MNTKFAFLKGRLMMPTILMADSGFFSIIVLLRSPWASPMLDCMEMSRKAIETLCSTLTSPRTLMIPRSPGNLLVGHQASKVSTMPTF